MTTPYTLTTLGATATPVQALVGCPDWCQWAVSHPRHEHSTTTGAELVVVEVYDSQADQHELVVLEVRHQAAPPTSI